MENDILTTAGTDNNELVKYMPRLKPESVAKAVVFAITVDEDVLVNFEKQFLCVMRCDKCFLSADSRHYIETNGRVLVDATAPL